MSPARLELRHDVRSQLSDAERQELAAAEAVPLELTVESVLVQASREARLDDFGPDDFVERLAVLLSVIAWKGHTKLTQLSAHRRIVHKAVNRLLTVDLLKRHPEIHDQAIRAPLIVAGLPRSGTTHLLNLIAADSRFQSTPYWEVLRPVPLLPEDEVGPDGVDPRWTRCEVAWHEMLRRNPHAEAAHPFNADHISEDGELQMQDFSSYVWEFSLYAPDWRDYYYSHDQTPHYAFEKTLLKILQWQRGGVRKRWIVKAPQHFEQLVPIMNVFPDAIVLFTHRDPVASLQSIVTGRISGALRRERTRETQRDLDYWIERYGHLLDAYLRDSQVVPPAQQFDVLFHEFIGDDVATVERIYDTAGISMTDQARAELTTYMSGHERGAHGQYVFDLRGDFGLDPAAVRERYGEYTAAIPVRTEAL
jgi:Sulfotransferase family